MQTTAPFLAVGDRFMSRGIVHTINDVERRGAERQVEIVGVDANGRPFLALLDWADSIDTLSSGVPPGAQGAVA